MPDFAYTARRSTGDKISGTLTAGSQREALAMLSGQELFPIEVVEEKARKAISFGKRVGGQEMATFYGQLAGLMRSGVPLLRSLEILRDQSHNSTLKEVMTDVYERVEDGEGLGEAMSRYPRVFNEMAVNMARAGAEGGFLEDAFDRVSAFTEQQVDLKARTVGALMYPVILAGMGSVIVGVLLIFFVPKFGEMFEQLRQRGELPALTDWLLAFSDGLRSYWYLIAMVAAVVGGFIYFQLKTEPGRRMADLIRLRLPMFGIIFKNLAVARFCRVLGTLLRNGVPILKSLEISREAAGNRILSDAIAKASENITAGESLATPLGKSGHFPVTVVEMISVAEESNSLDTVLVDIADGLEVRTQRNLDLLVRMLEPVMLLVMAGIVLFVVIALLLPVIKMSSAIG